MSDRTEYDCPVCEETWYYTDIELQFAKNDGHCHECEGPKQKE